MTDIDWLAVDMACEGVRLQLTAHERKAVIRRLSGRMMECKAKTQDVPDWILTTAKVAERLGMSTRGVDHIKANLPDATEERCPVCRGRMWVLLTNVVEPHGNGIHEECEMSNRLFGRVVGLLPSPFPKPQMRGLAAVRPDLYGWLVSA